MYPLVDPRWIPFFIELQCPSDQNTMNISFAKAMAFNYMYHNLTIDANKLVQDLEYQYFAEIL